MPQFTIEAAGRHIAVELTAAGVSAKSAAAVGKIVAAITQACHAWAKEGRRDPADLRRRIADAAK